MVFSRRKHPAFARAEDLFENRHWSALPQRPATLILGGRKPEAARMSIPHPNAGGPPEKSPTSTTDSLFTVRVPPIKIICLAGWPISGRACRGRALLRAWQPEDADAVYAACQDPHIQRWTNVPAPYQPHHATDLVERLAAQGWRTGRSTPLGVFDAETGALLGSHGLIAPGPHHRGRRDWNSGWRHGREATGRRAGDPRGRPLGQRTFSGLRQVIWRAKVGNHASRLGRATGRLRLRRPARDLVPAPGRRPARWLAGHTAPRRDPALRRLAWLAHGSACARRARTFGSPAAPAGRRPR